MFASGTGHAVASGTIDRVFANITSENLSLPCTFFDSLLSDLARKLKAKFGDKIRTEFRPTAESYGILLLGPFSRMELMEVYFILDDSNLLIHAEDWRI